MSRPRRCWIALFHGVHTDPKTIELACCLDIGTAQAVGHLTALWLEIMAHNTKGDIPFDSPEVVERWAQWRGDPGALYQWMIECGWIKKCDNGSAFASGWWECNGSFLRAAESKLAYKRKLSDSPSVHVPIPVPRPNQELTTSVNPAPAVLTKTVTVRDPNKPTPSELDSFFERWWVEGPAPRKVQKANARKAFHRKAPKNRADLEPWFNRLMELTKRRWREWQEREPSLRPHPATFLNAEEF